MFGRRGSGDCREENYLTLCCSITILSVQLPPIIFPLSLFPVQLVMMFHAETSRVPVNELRFVRLAPVQQVGSTKLKIKCAHREKPRICRKVQVIRKQQGSVPAAVEFFLYGIFGCPSSKNCEKLAENCQH